jgi:hypothetical protein
LNSIPAAIEMALETRGIKYRWRVACAQRENHIRPRKGVEILELQAKVEMAPSKPKILCPNSLDRLSPSTYIYFIPPQHLFFKK